MGKYTLTHAHSFYSLLDGLSSPADIAERAVELGMNAIAITDHYSIAGIVKFHRACKKNGIKPLLGCEIGVSDAPAEEKGDENRKNRHLIIIAKNKEGYSDLIQLTSEANKHYYYNPRLDKEKLLKYASKGNLIAASACIAGVVASKLFTDQKAAFSAKTEKECASFLRSDWLKFGCEESLWWESAFGKGNFFLEIQKEGLPSQEVVMRCIREIAKKTGIKIIATGDAHYARPEDHIEHEILICSQTNTTLKKRQEMRDEGIDILFSDNTPYYIKSYEEMAENFKKEELENTNKLAALVEEYDIEATAPLLPEFPLEAGVDKDKFFIKLCNDGLKRIGKEKNKEYLERFEYEFGIFSSVKTANASLLDYFLIVWDIVEKIRELGSTTPVGRGSAAGCLCSYLMGITKLDPIEYKLSFQRFFNTGRLSEGRIALPDIDLDCSSEIRGDLIQHLKDRYGEENVCQISTFGTLAPKAAIKETFRAHGIDFSEANQFTKHFPDSELKHDDDSKYTIEDALKISPEFAEMADKYKSQIHSAIKIEGTNKNRGIHAAGIVIGDRPIAEFLPLVWDTKSKSLVCALEMSDVEALGGCKIDLLGLRLLHTIDLCVAKINELNLKPKTENINTFEMMVLDYFSFNGFNVKEEEGIFKATKDGIDRFFVVEQNFLRLFEQPSDSVKVFSERYPEEFAITKRGDSVMVVKGRFIKSKNRYQLKRFGKIEDCKIIKE